MIYKISFTERAVSDVLFLKKTNLAAYTKLQALLLDIQEHPYIELGKPERMKHDYAGCYSRHITVKHRIVYKVFEEAVEVLVISACKHYKDK